MRLVTFEVQTPVGRFSRLGALVRKPEGGDDHVLDLNAAYAWILKDEGEAQPQRLAEVLCPPAMREFIEMGPRALTVAQQVIALYERQGSDLEWESVSGLYGAQLLFPLSQVALKTPLPNPNSLRDFMTFEEHMQAGCDRRGLPMPEAWYQYPVYYKGNHRSLIGHGEPLLWPSYSNKLDYELELACIIGREGRDIPVELAGQYIFGYTVMNDFSARDIQLQEMTCRLGPAKGKDFGTAVGPCIVTADEVDARNLRMTATINGELWSEGNSGTSYWTFEQMIAHVSREETLYPGDIFGSGTVGKGCGLDLDRWLQPGDVIELEIEGLGVLRNRIVSSREAADPPASTVLFR
jgi:2-keto-4-pentenoate hydratase/2-oxohepta-3-ene-1,7-dioic acid hydratase in catechol pathway